MLHIVSLLMCFDLKVARVASPSNQFSRVGPVLAGRQIGLVPAGRHVSSAHMYNPAAE